MDQKHVDTNETTDEAGLVCPKCCCTHFWVVRTSRKFERIIRVRECRHCGRRLQTQEAFVGK